MPQTNIHASYFNVKIEGAILPDEISDHIVDISIENTLHLPDVATVRIEDTEFNIHTRDQFKIGKSIEILFGTARDQLTSAFIGEIIGIDHDMAAHMIPSFVVRCFDKSHRLHRGRQRRAFQNTKDSDLVQQLAGEVGLQSQIDSTTEVHPYTFQNNLTNWEFIQYLAHRNNFRAFVGSDNKLHFTRMNDAATNSVSLEWGETLTSFRPRVSSSGQVPKVIVKSWDPGGKQGITGQATTPTKVPQLGMNTHGGEVAQQAFGDSQMTVVDRVPRTQDGANQYAQSILDGISAGFVKADGLCQYNPDIKPGASVNVPNIGPHMSGDYGITGLNTHYSPAEGLSMQFEASGKTADTVTDILAQGRTHEHHPINSVVVGLVTNNQDPDGMCRIKVKFPWLSDDVESWWARIASPMAGPGRGFEFLPEVGDEVLCAFEHGDPRFPYVLGALWNGKDAPGDDNGKAVTGEGVVRRSIKTRIGHFMLMDDTGGEGEISFKTKGGHFVCINDKDKQILLQTTKGHKVLLDDQGSKIQIVDYTSSNSMEIDSNSGNISFNCTGSFSISAGMGISMTSGTSFSISAGTTYSMSASATASITSMGTMTITGSMVNIN